ncbi:hypothetical protein A2631_04165 [Candidatus Daviesbacteria bacterium RIFCSPHIGHO2_01_FULL_44_29]|uniref:Uncharacterized protein n=1 Tax=Candidatus Daviesbacteria bacterium RIFCSPHIGHO2_02_FULL_43_12 TaxID=1797776 RepID=A0A1F5KG47_9BACT|nr:MAG: hypothetical protein A2631_04165 [Candidatus Daviesbacteria bacterium RIFCSPHIGHO2_01_FULL_44_29]OGE39923.1 MAG: hypothetical protein A3D25_03895 [Candidatus Daviesbacteria bacterium RIFCSPHIGHO2_02_FULL_43_12]OGE40519.1 MAG: hypothetical protein A3E86_00890 [Candidatus Daviesbacteria bacterium RIFCSPHIGHO2_12_FULL_47_45]OGE70396.1 MAG: hypothetical protein A3B55_01675 [Candidatus Daviesbacteria bacterium RIFCSPLOWO2_01_FULL_43_15]
MKQYSADFRIGDKLIEFFGLAGEHTRYDELREIKLNLVKKYKLPLLEIYPKDLYKDSHYQVMIEDFVKPTLTHPKKAARTNQI